ncbi:hypothetical protein ACFSTD_16990 [Novosphingobium colocasiae]
MALAKALPRVRSKPLSRCNRQRLQRLKSRDPETCRYRNLNSDSDGIFLFLNQHEKNIFDRLISQKNATGVAIFFTQKRAFRTCTKPAAKAYRNCLSGILSQNFPRPGRQRPGPFLV